MKIHKLLICAAVLLLSAPLHAAEYTMMLSHAGPASDINDDYVGATAIKSYIEEKTGGKVEVDAPEPGRIVEKKLLHVSLVEDPGLAELQFLHVPILLFFLLNQSMYLELG